MTTPVTTLTVYFEGTSNELDRFVTQIGLFSALTHATDLLQNEVTKTQRQYKISYDGCGVTNGMGGLLFATGLMDQCREVCRCVEALQAAGHTRIVLNAVGLSRGGIAVIYLAQMLGHLDAACVSLNLLLFDPVPGNLICAARFMDPFSLVSTANASLRLTSCHNIQHVLALYPYQALPDFAFHAPLLPCYPSHCCVEEDAVLGCHQGALFCSRQTSSRLSFVRIRDWLLAHGTVLHYSGDAGVCAKSLAMSPQECLRLMQFELEELKKYPREIRYAHSSPAGAYIEKREDGNDVNIKYLNKWHRALSSEDDSTGARISSTSDLLLEIHRKEPYHWFTSCVGSTT